VYGQGYLDLSLHLLDHSPKRGNRMNFDTNEPKNYSTEQAVKIQASMIEQNQMLSFADPIDPHIRDLR
jgi:hypothetical protein